MKSSLVTDVPVLFVYGTVQELIINRPVTALIQVQINDESNPDDVVLYPYTTYDSSSFDPISITSSPMILVQTRRFHNSRCIEITPAVKL